MTERDTRWEKVEASIGDPYNYRYDIDYDWPKKGQFVEIEFCVRHKGQFFWQRIKFAQEDWDSLDWEPKRFILNEMVIKLDEAIAYWERTGEHIEW